MATALTAEQINRVVTNTVIVLLARADLMAEWRANLSDLLLQARSNQLDDEALFIAAVLTLLNSPDDDLPTGTSYDRAWEAIRLGLQTGSIPGMEEETEDTDKMTVERLLSSVTEAVVAVMTRLPEQKAALAEEMRAMQQSATDAGIDALASWLADALALMNGAPPHQLGRHHQGVYSAYWKTLVNLVGPQSE